MRKKIVAGNWKMNENLQEGIILAKEINTVLEADKPNCGVVICTPFIHLASVARYLTNLSFRWVQKTVPTKKRVHTPARFRLRW